MRDPQDSLRFHRIKHLFDETVDLAPEERLSYLQEACKDEPDLLSEILALFHQHDNGASILDLGLPEVASHVFAGWERTVSPGDFRQYRLGPLLGEGGSGTVYRAERTDIGSVAAIKILSSGTLSPSRRQRFTDEQKTLVQLDHPLIARIFDADILQDGTPWFAMEYVEGMPVTAYCESRNCQMAERLQLFRSVCTAVQYAHDRAILHRDLKPSNIFVKPDGTVKLLDFGIAKQLNKRDSDTGQTRTGQMLMTLAYASPEQIRGEALTVQSDVYSLGVILYELLTGTLHFDLSDKTPAEAERIMLEQQQERPSAACHKLARPRKIGTLGRDAWNELDVICMTAMHRDAERRYRSADALIRDIDHFLRNEPLEARPDSFGYKLRKFVRRNRTRLAVSTAILLAAAALSIIVAIRLGRARDAVLQEAMRTQRIEQFMLNLFDGGDKTAGPADDLRVVALLGRGVKTAEALKAEPAVQVELLQTLGTIYQRLGRLDQADKLLSTALERRKSLAGPNSDDVAASLVSLGLLRLDQSKVEDAEHLVRQGLALYRQHLPSRDPAIARADFALGRVLEERGDYAGASKLLDETVSLQSAQGQRTTDLSDSMNALLIANIDMGNFTAADALGQRALAMDRDLYGAIHPRVGDDLANLGVIQYDLRHYFQAEQYYRQALSIKRSWYGLEHPDTAICMVGVGQALLAQQHYDGAADMLHEALAIQERIFGKVHPQIAIGLNMLGSLEMQRGHLDDAEADFRRMADINRSVYGDRHFLVGVALASLAKVNVKKNQPADAERDFREALADFTATLAPGHPYIGIAEAGLGRSLISQGRYKEAEGPLLAGYKILASQANPSAKDITDARNSLITLYTALNEPDRAAAYWAEAHAAFNSPARQQE